MMKTSKWIWTDRNSDSVNTRVLFRKKFTLKCKMTKAVVSVTADSRYRLFINGTWINDGPARSYPWRYSYDIINITRYLKPGENVISAYVIHWGEGSFQTLVTRAGFLAEIELSDGGGKETIGTDHSWKAIPDPGYNQYSPRISTHLGHEEQHHAELCPYEWQNVDFDDSVWPTAIEICDIENGPWKNLTASKIPLLEKETVYAKQVLSCRYVKTPQIVETLSFKKFFWPEEKENSLYAYRCILATCIVSETTQKAKIFRPTSGMEIGIVYVGNNRPIACDGSLEDCQNEILINDFVEIEIRKGTNPVFVVFDGQHHMEEYQLIFDASDKIELRNPFGEGTVSLSGMFEPDDPKWMKIKHSTTFQDIERYSICFKTPRESERPKPDVHALTCHQQTLCGEPDIKTPPSLLFDNEDLTTIKACNKDVEILIDLGQEYNCHIGFELFGPKGVIIDGNIFEMIWNGKPQWTWRNRSGFRYVTRDGWQKFLTWRHFGGRFVALTFRNLQQDIQIRWVYAKFKHFAVQHRAKFKSSDHLLNQIWTTSKQTLLCCMEDTFTDCPTYEQAFWLGDSRNSALVCDVFFGEQSITKRCVELASLSLAKSDLIFSQVPSSWFNIIPVWSFLWLKMAWECYQRTEDKALLQDVIYPAALKMLKNCEENYFDSETGLFSIAAWNFFDWTGIDSNHKCVTHNNIFLVDAMRTLSKISDVFGERDISDKWMYSAEILCANINKSLWSEEKKAYIDSIHDDGKPSTSISQPINTLALLYGVAPDYRAKRILPIATGKKKENIIPFGSPFSMSYLLEYLCESGKCQEALEIIRTHWGGMMLNDTTTFWESFNDATLGGKFPTRSYCHGWSSSPAYILTRYILGVDFCEVGQKTVLLKPCLNLLDNLDAVVPTVRGDISISWKKLENQYIITLSVPQNIEAIFELVPDIEAKYIEINGQRIHGDTRRFELPHNVEIFIFTALPKKIDIRTRHNRIIAVK